MCALVPQGRSCQERVATPWCEITVFIFSLNSVFSYGSVSFRSTVVLSAFTCQSHVLLSSPRVLHPLPKRRSRALPPQASLGSRHPGASPTSRGHPQVPRRGRCWGGNSILHDPLGLSLRSKVSLSVGGSEPGAPVPLRSMSDPDQDFDKEVCVP